MNVVEFTFGFLLIIAFVALIEAGTMALLIYINKYGFKAFIEAIGEELTDFIEQTANFLIKLIK